MGELYIPGCMIFDEVLVCGGCGEFTVFFAELMLLIVGSRPECCKE
jgi:hypothetical protein